MTFDRSWFQDLSLEMLVIKLFWHFFGSIQSQTMKNIDQSMNALIWMFHIIMRYGWMSLDKNVQ